MSKRVSNEQVTEYNEEMRNKKMNKVGIERDSELKKVRICSEYGNKNKKICPEFDLEVNEANLNTKKLSTEEIKCVTDTAIKYVKDGQFVRVEPYWFDYCTWAKGRWFNIPLLTVFQREFRDRPAAYYSHACHAGLIRVNDTQVPPEYLIKQGDRLQHRIHRHEPPVLCEPKPEIVHVGEGFLVVNKPPSIPMHPSGRYRHNTLTSHLLHSNPELFPTGHISCVNRLDRLVSGIVILSRSAAKADELRRAMQEMLFRKFYLARVQGDFTRDDLKNRQYIKIKESVNESKNAAVIECVAPLLIVEHKMGLSCVADSRAYPAAKSAHTRFYKLSYTASTDSSLILCEPVTGRTHQIRLHLQYLAHPIINDPLYNNSFWRELLTDETGDEIYKSSAWIQKVKEMTQEMSKSSLFQQDDENNQQYPIRSESESELSISTAICPDCENPRTDPDPGALSIDLHAYKYSGPMGTFSTKLPAWAADLIESDSLKLAEVAFDTYASIQQKIE